MSGDVGIAGSVSATRGDGHGDVPDEQIPEHRHVVAESKHLHLLRWVRLAYPEEILAVVLVLVTAGVNVAIHHTLDANILFATVNTYQAIFNIHIHEFGRALRYFAMAYVSWEFLRFLAGRPVHLVEWRRSGKLAVVLRALPTYFLCGAAFGNLSGFIHRLSPSDHDQWLITADRIIGFGHDPIKLLEPLVTETRVRFFLQVYLSLYLIPWFAMMLFVSRGQLRAFRDQVVAWWLALTIGW